MGGSKVAMMMMLLSNGRHAEFSVAIVHENQMFTMILLFETTFGVFFLATPVVGTTLHSTWSGTMIIFKDLLCDCT